MYTGEKGVRTTAVPAVVIAIIAFWLSLLPATAAEVVRLDANESPPYWSASMPGQGMCGELVQAIARASGIELAIQFKPLNRMIEDDANNDLGNPAFFMRNQEFAAIIPIAVYHVSVFRYQPNHQKPLIIRSLEDIKGFRVGVLKGTLVDRSYFASAGIRVEESYSQASLFRKLHKGRIDMIVDIDLSGHHMIHDLFPDEVDAFAVDIIEKSESPIAILLSLQLADGSKVAKHLREGLERIKASGEYQAIVEKYYASGSLPGHYMAELALFSFLYQFADGE